MTSLDHTTSTTADVTSEARMRESRLAYLHGPRFMPIDVAAFVAGVAMIWGPLIAGALRQ